jgi:ABC-type branched-subunit amino acid transport system substrate-binding protein
VRSADDGAAELLVLDLPSTASAVAYLGDLHSSQVAESTYEAVALILDAIAESGGDREAAVRAARATTDRDSVLGRCSIDAEGHTPATAYGQLAVVDGELVSA